MKQIYFSKQNLILIGKIRNKQLNMGCVGQQVSDFRIHIQLVNLINFISRATCNVSFLEAETNGTLLYLLVERRLDVVGRSPRTGGRNRRKIIISSSSRPRHLKCSLRPRAAFIFFCFCCVYLLAERALNCVAEQNVAKVEIWQRGCLFSADLGDKISFFSIAICAVGMQRAGLVRAAGCLPGRIPGKTPRWT